MLNPRHDPWSPARWVWDAALQLRQVAPPRPNPAIQDADYHYHKQIVDGFVDGLRGAGAIIITEVRLIALNGLTARADFMGMLPEYGGVVMTEVKTSLALDDYDDFPGLPRYQPNVYRLVPMGGRVMSPDRKIAELGLVPFLLFPPMRLQIIRAIPELPFDIKDYAPGTIILPGIL